MKLYNLVHNDYEFKYVYVDGTPWMLGKDICKLLELKNVSMTLKNLNDDEKQIYSIFISAQNRDYLFVNEKGFNSLIFKSKKPEAIKIRNFICGEVMPSILRNGYYIPNQNHLDDTERFRFPPEQKNAIKDNNSRISRELPNPKVYDYMKESISIVKSVTGLTPSEYKHQICTEKELVLCHYKSAQEYMRNYEPHISSTCGLYHYFRANDVPLEEMDNIGLAETLKKSYYLLNIIKTKYNLE